MANKGFVYSRTSGARKSSMFCEVSNTAEFFLRTRFMVFRMYSMVVRLERNRYCFFIESLSLQSAIQKDTAKIRCPSFMIFFIWAANRNPAGSPQRQPHRPCCPESETGAGILTQTKSSDTCFAKWNPQSAMRTVPA